MPKFLSYQRPAPVDSAKWNSIPGKAGAAIPTRKSKLRTKTPAPETLPPLKDLLSKQDK